MLELVEKISPTFQDYHMLIVGRQLPKHCGQHTETRNKIMITVVESPFTDLDTINNIQLCT